MRGRDGNQLEAIQANAEKRDEASAQALTAEEAREEIACDMLGDILQDERLFDSFLRDVERGSVKPSVAQKIIDALRDILDRIRYGSAVQDAADDLGLTEQEIRKAMDKLSAAAKAAGGNENAASEGGGERLSIEYDRYGTPYVVIENDILDGVPQKDWVTTVKNNLRDKFPNGVTIGNQVVKINLDSRRELTYSNYMQRAFRTDQQAYEDKLRATDNADEIVAAAHDWVNEALGHSRKGSILDFARGEVQIRIGNNDYTAQVIVGNRGKYGLLLYDIINLTKTNIQSRAKKVNTAYTANAQNEPRSRQAISTINTIPQSPPKSNTQKTSLDETREYKRELERMKRRAEYQDEAEKIKRESAQLVGSARAELRAAVRRDVESKLQASGAPESMAEPLTRLLLEERITDAQRALLNAEPAAQSILTQYAASEPEPVARARAKLAAAEEAGVSRLLELAEAERTGYNAIKETDVKAGESNGREGEDQSGGRGDQTVSVSASEADGGGQEESGSTWREMGEAFERRVASLGGLWKIQKHGQGRLAYKPIISENVTEIQRITAEGLRRLGVQVIFTDGAFETNFLGRTVSHTEAVTVGDDVFISSQATMDPVNIYHHEAMHVMKNVESQLYDIVYDTFGSLWDKTSTKARELVYYIGKIYLGEPACDKSTGEQIEGFDDGNWDHIEKVFNEMIAYVSGFNASDPAYAREEFGGAFTDYDGFIRVLNEIWERFSASRQSNRADVQTNQEGVSFEGVKGPSQEQEAEVLVNRIDSPSGNVAFLPFGNLRQTDKQLLKSKRSYEILLAAHQKKLLEYMENPYAFDNKGLLKNSEDPEIREKIIKGRTLALQKQIEKHKGELEKMLDEMKERGMLL